MARMDGVAGVEQEEKESSIGVGRRLQLLRNLGIQDMVATMRRLAPKVSDSTQPAWVWNNKLKVSAGSRVTVVVPTSTSRIEWHHCGKCGGGCCPMDGGGAGFSFSADHMKQQMGCIYWRTGGEDSGIRYGPVALRHDPGHASPLLHQFCAAKLQRPGPLSLQ